MVPKTKKELLTRLPGVLNGEWREIPAVAGRGTGAPGNFLEQLLGAEGANKAMADTVGVEVKYHSNGRKGSLLTLLHQEVEGGKSSLLPLVREFGIKKKGLLNFRHTVNPTSPFCVDREPGKVIVRRKSGDGHRVFWAEATLLNAVIRKLNCVILVEGQMTTQGGKRYVRYISAQWLTDFKSTEFLSHLLGRYIIVEFDARETAPGSTSLRNHGTKLRMKVTELNQVWSEIEPIMGGNPIQIRGLNLMVVRSPTPTKATPSVTMRMKQGLLNF